MSLQVSDQCARMVKAGWFDQQKEPSGVSTLTDPKVSKLTVAVTLYPQHGQADSHLFDCPKGMLPFINNDDASLNAPLLSMGQHS